MRANRPIRATLGAALLLTAMGMAPALASPGETGLEVGFGRVSLVTEIPGVTLGGYGGRGLVPAQGVHDPTYVKAMVIRTPQRAVALVTYDLIGVQRTILEAIRRRGLPARVRLTADDLLLCASHTHAGYGSLAQRTGGLLLDGLFFVTCGPFRRAFFDEVVERTIAAITAAWDDLAPARIGVGSGRFEGLSHNRGRHGDVTDPEIGLIKVTDPRGRVRGLVVNFTAHPTILGADNLLLSAGYPGALQRALERRYPGATVLFTNGAEGDTSVSVPDGRYANVWERVEATGRRLADCVAQIEPGIETRPSVGLAFRCLRVRFPEPSGWRARLKFRGGQPDSLFCQLVIGDAIFMGVPGEPCCRIGLDMKAAARRRGFRHAFVLGLAQDHCGYFVHACDYGPGMEESHDYEKQLNFYGPGVGAFIVRTHMETLGLAPIVTERRPAAGAGSR
ncbi:MAG: hypothetical protein D6776_12145 [Planctomycetota bacterium]|nr:MAG: hypothetical protein D6776_12145 [Planctomycetota bacterium]